MERWLKSPDPDRIRITRENLCKQRGLGVDPELGTRLAAKVDSLRPPACKGHLLRPPDREVPFSRREGDPAERIAVILHSPQPPQEKSHENLP